MKKSKESKTFSNGNSIQAGQIALLVKSGALSKKALGITNEDAKNMYLRARKLYDSGKYREAKAIFSVLALVDSKVPAVLYGLGSCCMMLQEYEAAIDIFLEYGALVLSDPLPYYYISHCCEKRKDKLSTMVALQTAINRAGDHPQYQEIKQRALLALESLATKSQSEFEKEPKSN